jgi:hypothetical protein
MPYLYALARKRVRLFVVLWILFIVLVCWSAFPNGIAGRNVQVQEFSLCEGEDFVNGKPQQLGSRVISPTSTIYACGYMRIEKPPSSFEECLSFYLYRNDKQVSAPLEDFCSRDSVYFSHPLNTKALLTPGKYRLQVFDLASRVWSEYVFFEVRDDNPLGGDPSGG